MKRKVLQWKQGSLIETSERVTERKNDLDKKEWQAALVFASNVGFAIALPIVAGAVAGSYLDKRFSSTPLYTLSLIFLGVLIGFVSIVRRAGNQ